jgi:hypothetical protein
MKELKQILKLLKTDQINIITIIVEYNDFRYEPDIKYIGLIAQEVDLFIPEAVGVNEFDYINVSHNNNSLVGLLVESIKELNNEISSLENIVIKESKYIYIYI